MPVFLINSRYSHFTAAFLIAQVKHTLSRSYGIKLPSSLTKFHSIALEYSSHSPESVYGTGSLRKHNEVFLGGMEFDAYETRSLLITIQSCNADLPTLPPTRLNHYNH
jgi:hypothetical protein